MKRLDIVIRPDKLESLKTILSKHAIGGMTIYSCMGCGNQKGNLSFDSYKGLDISNINLIPKITITAVINDDKVDGVLADIHTQIATGKVGDGKVFVYDVIDAMRIRTGDRGKNAL